MLGSMLGSYRLLRVLGQGGMGVVYEAEHQLLGRRAAVKLLLPEVSSGDVVTRFFNEARATSLIQHPGIVDILDFGYAGNGAAFIVMELLEGESLRTRLARERRPPVDVVIGITRHIAAALGAAHRKGIVHRDLKPDNVFLIADPASPGGVRPKILDFGIAKLVRDQSATSLKTRTGSVLGTPLYMSPEQCRGAGAAIDARADIYSLGCIVFEMVCGRPPFLDEGLGELFVAHLRDAPPPPRSLNPSISPDLEAVILRLLAKQPGQRPQGMDAVIAELDDAASRGGLAAAATTLGNAAAQVVAAPAVPGRRRWWLAAGVVVALAGGAIAVVETGREPPAATVTAAAPEPPPPPPAPAMVRLSIESSPAGAEVWQGGVSLGKTPLVRSVAQAPGKLALRLVKEGFAPAQLEVSTAADAVAMATLAPVPPPAPAAPPPEPVPVAAPAPPSSVMPEPPAPAPAPTHHSSRPASAKKKGRVNDQTVDPFAN